MVGKSFDISAILFYLASDANKTSGTEHHLQAGIYGFSGEKKKHEVLFSNETSYA